MILNALILTNAQDNLQPTFIGLRRDSHADQICVYSGDPDPSASSIRRSNLNPISRIRASEILREARDTGAGLSEDVGPAGDGGLVMEFIGEDGRELMVTVSASGAWTYFATALAGKQVAAGILRDDGIRAAMRWVAGLEKDLSGPGIITG